MRVTATVEMFASKEAAISGIRTAHWAEGDVDFSTLVRLYMAGHAFNISDDSISDAFIVDLDALLPWQAESLATDSYRKVLATAIGADSCIFLPSSSRNPLKGKLFFKVHFRRDIRNNIDQANRRLRQLLEEKSGLVADPKMDTYTQLTFGCKMQGDAGPNLSAWTPSVQPRIRQKASKNTAAKKCETQFIPLNMGAYNRKYGKMMRKGGRLEWHVYFYGKSGRAVNVIREGSRHKALPRLYAAIIWNAIFLNTAAYKPISGEHVPFSLDDCAGTLRKVVLFQFENGHAFWESEGRSAVSVLASMWNEYVGMSPDNAYSSLLEKTGAKERTVYRPKDQAASAIYRGYRAAFVKCATMDEIKNLAAKAAGGDTKIMSAIIRKCRKDSGTLKNKKGHPKTDFYQYLMGCTADLEGNYMVSRTQYNKKEFREFCKTHGYAIKKMKY